MAANDEDDENKEALFNVLLGVTGSVAAIKVPLLVERLLQIPKVKVRVVATQNSMHFFDQTSLPVRTYEDRDEWQLRRWADMFLIAPLDANTMAKLSHGICDNLVTCVARAWDVSKPVIYCPAMNTHMWEHPLTNEHLTKLESLNYVQIPPVSKTLACGDCGVGAMAEVSTIVETVKHFLEQHCEMKKTHTCET